MYHVVSTFISIRVGIPAGYQDRNKFFALLYDTLNFFLHILQEEEPSLEIYERNSQRQLYDSIKKNRCHTTGRPEDDQDYTVILQHSSMRFHHELDR